MGHHHQEPDSDSQNQPVLEKPPHPFFEQEDLTYLAMIKPLLSSRGQKLLNFFLNFDSQDAGNGLPDLAGILKGMSLPAGGQNGLATMLPALMGMLGSDNNAKGKINPALLTALMALLNNKKEDSSSS